MSEKLILSLPVTAAKNGQSRPGTARWLLQNAGGIHITTSKSGNQLALLLDRAGKRLDVLAMRNGWAQDTPGNPAGGIRKAFNGSTHNPGDLATERHYTDAGYRLLEKIQARAIESMKAETKEDDDIPEVEVVTVYFTDDDVAYQIAQDGPAMLPVLRDRLKEVS